MTRVRVVDGCIVGFAVVGGTTRVDGGGCMACWEYGVASRVLGVGREFDIPSMVSPRCNRIVKSHIGEFRMKSSRCRPDTEE